MSLHDNNDFDNLIEKCKKGDSKAFDSLLQGYSKRCYAYFYRLTGRADVSEELLSDLYIRLVQKIDTFKTGSFDKWIFTIASNLFRDYLRKIYRQKKLLQGKAELLRQNENKITGEPEIVDTLHIALEKLDTDTAELITLRYYGQLSFKEMAQIRNEPIGTTLSKVHRGIKKLRQIMDEL